MPSFRWSLCQYIGGDYAVHPSYKSYLILRPDGGMYTAGSIPIVARDTSTISVNCGFEPNLLMLFSYRPKFANGSWDSSFGNRGGGCTIGVAGYDTHGNDAQFTGSTRIQQGWDLAVGYKRWREDVCFNVVHGGAHDSTCDDTYWSGWPNVDALTLTHAFTASGFDLTQTLNLYDSDSTVYFIAMYGDFTVGVMDAGDTVVSKTPYKPEGAFFFSAKTTTANDIQSNRIRDCLLTTDPWHQGYWDIMTGFASPDAQVCTWGGARPSGWNWTTEHFRDDSAIVLCTAANGSSLVGTSLDQQGQIVSWWDDVDTVTITRSGGTATVSHTGHGFTSGQLVLIAGADQGAYNGVQQITFVDANSYTYTVTGSPATPATGTITATVGGIDIQWPIFNNIPYRVGYVLSKAGEAGYFEANFEKRPSGSQADPDGLNTQLTRITPRVILMATTNYNFNYIETDPLALPRAINDFDKGGGGGLGWHWFLTTDVPANGIHTYGNSVQEMGHYSNSATSINSNCIMPGAGANSNPPAAHEHSIDIHPNPVIVGTNYRYAERHAEVHRLHVNPSDT